MPSLLHINYYSTPLEKQSAMFVIHPDGNGPFPVIYLLHGLTDDYTAWQRYTRLEKYAAELGVFIVLPDGGRSFYTDMQHNAGNYEGHILGTVNYIDRTFNTIATPEARGIGGLSMGGFGAVKLSLKYPDLFGSATAHSAPLDMRDRNELPNLPIDFNLVFGATLAPEDDPVALAERPGKKPALAIDCGADDQFIAINRRYDAHLTELGIEHRYQEFPGGHSWEYWNEHIVAALRFHKSHFDASLS